MEPTIMTTLSSMCPALLAYIGILVLGLLRMYVSEVVNGQRPNPFRRKAKRDGKKQLSESETTKDSK